MEEKFMEDCLERMTVGNEKLLEAYANLDPRSETYLDDLQAAKDLHAEIAKDSRNYWALKNAEVKSKNDKDAALFSNIVKAAVAGVSLIGVGVSIWSEKLRHLRFGIANGVEDERAYLKLSERKAVEEGLREMNGPSKGILGLFGK